MLILLRALEQRLKGWCDAGGVRRGAGRGRAAAVAVSPAGRQETLRGHPQGEERPRHGHHRILG